MILMEPLLFCVLIGAGVLAGFMSGLVGVGGGFIFVPAMYFVMIASNVPPELAILVAFGTSLAVALPTVLTSALGHTRKGNVCWHDAVFIGVSGMITGFVGGTVAAHLPVDVLTSLFGIMLLIGATRMVATLPSGGDAKSLSAPKSVGIGGFTGFMSGLLGVGGGTVLVPLLTILGKYQMVRAAATSAAAIVFITLGGVTSYLLNGMNVHADLSEYGFHLVGYIDLFMGGILVVTAVPLAVLGVKYSSKFPDKLLRRVFVLLMVVIALDMLGVFSFVGGMFGLSG